MVVDGEVTEVTVIAVLTHVFSRQSLTLAYAVGKPPMVVVTVQGALLVVLVHLTFMQPRYKKYNYIVVGKRET